MRNGDYLPSRFEAQADCVNLIANGKTSQNPETTVGLLASAPRPSVMQTLAQDPTDVLSALHNVRISGEADLVGALEVAHLALKHRSNKNGGQRIVVFVGSPIKEDAKGMTRLGKKLKKSGVSLDIISMGDDLENDERLRALLEAVDKGGASHWVHVPSGPGLIMADVIVSSPVFFGGEGVDPDVAAVAAAEAASGGGGAASSAASTSGGSSSSASSGGARPMMGVDPNVDPELYEAIQMSLREEAERNASAAPATANAPPAAGNSNNAPAASKPDTGGPQPMDLGADEMDEEMRNAIALSMQMQGGGDDFAGMPPLGSDEKTPLLSEDDAEALKVVIKIGWTRTRSCVDRCVFKLSKALAQQSEKEDAVKNDLQNPDYVRQLFGGLPVDLDDASIQAALEAITKGGGGAPKNDEGKPSDPKKKKEGEK
jgi:26S proteasome regulatory subunit N10